MPFAIQVANLYICIYIYIYFLKVILVMGFVIKFSRQGVKRPVGKAV